MEIAFSRVYATTCWSIKEEGVDVDITLEQIKNTLPQFDEVLPVDQVFSWSGGLAYAAAWIRKGDKLSLLLLWQEPEEEREERERRERHRAGKARRGRLTNRDSYLLGMGSRSLQTGREIRVNGKAYGVCSFQSGEVGEWDLETRLVLIELMRRGVKLEFCGEELLSRLYVGVMELDGEFRRIPAKWKCALAGKAPLHISWMPDHSDAARVLKRKLTLTAGKQEIKLSFRDKAGKGHVLYVLGLSYYDIWEEEAHRFEDPRYLERFGAEEIEEMKKTFERALEENYAPGTLLPIVEYEAEEGIQAQFYTQEELDALVEEHGGSCSAMFVVLRPDNPEGGHGGRRRCCVCGGRQDAPEKLEVELLYVRIQEEQEEIVIEVPAKERAVQKG